MILYKVVETYSFGWTAYTPVTRMPPMTDAEREELLQAFKTWSKWSHLFTDQKYAGIDAALSKPMNKLWPQIYDEGYRAGLRVVGSKTRAMYWSGILMCWSVAIFNFIMIFVR